MRDTTNKGNETTERKDAKEQSISIRFPLDVLAAVKALAKQHERSFNGEVIWALRTYLEHQESDNRYR